MKKLAALFLIIIFILFFAYIKLEKGYYDVLQVISPTEVIVDVNHNHKAEQEEYFNIDLISFSTKIINPLVCKNLGISNEDYIKLGYIAETYTKSLLENKKVELKNGKIFIDGKNYEEILLLKGFALKHKQNITKSLKENLENVRSLNLVILNNNNNKYHKLSCKFGLISANSQVLLKKYLPKSASPCKFCHSEKEIEINNDNFFKKPPLVFQNEYIKLLLTNFEIEKPNNKCTTSACKTLLNEINHSQKSIEFAIFGYTKIPALETALLNARKRGVKIRFVYDISNNTNIYPDTIYLSKVFKFNNNDVVPSIMHNKFFIFDNKKVFTGSANISNTDMSGFNSNVSIIIDSPQIAEYYSQEFEQMYLGNFHRLKLLIDKPPVTIGDSLVSCYFSPRDKVIKNNLIAYINDAKKYIYIPAFLITHYSMTEALIKAKLRGVDVKIILDATNAHKQTHSKIVDLRKAKIPVKTENFAGKMHSKTILIDDKYTILGSMNFSRSGEEINDENILIIKDNEITKFYKNYFNYIWNKIPNKWLTLSARAESPDSKGSCSDGIDNDFDGKIDMQDDSCTAIFIKK